MDKITYYYIDEDTGIEKKGVSNATVEDAIDAALDYLDADIVGERVSYYADEIGRVVIISAEDLLPLGAAVLDGRGNAAYSLWATGTDVDWDD